MQKAELVFVPLPVIGHFVSTVEFAKSLLERDQRLSATILVIRSALAQNTISHTRELAASNSNIRFIDLPQADPPPAELKSPVKYFTILVENHKSHVKEAIINHLSSNSTPIAGLVLDMFCVSMIDVANELAIPSYVFFASGAACLGLLFYLPVHYTETGRDFNATDPDSVIPTFANPVPSSVFPSFDESSMNLAMRMKESKGIFINTFAELEPHAIMSLRSNSTTTPIYTIGPLLNLEGQEKSNSESEKIRKWLDDQPPSSVVFLCFGSAGGFEPPQLAEIATALEQSGHRFLWSLRRPQSKDFTRMPGEYTNISELLPKGFLERTENKGLVCGWAPQMEILAHKAVGGFVSHCGWNSILESIWHGVPIATWPIYAEQKTNAFLLVKELEIAVELRIDYRLEDSDKLVMADEIEKAIGRLMNAENPVRKSMKEMSEISRKAVVEGGSSFISVKRLIEDSFVV